jgi:hypothetical protein
MLLLPADEAADLATLPEIFANASIEPEPLRGAFGVCYVAFAGTHEKRYRGERILEAAASQLRAAAAAHGTGVIDQCVFTDQPERPRPYVQLSLPLRTPLDGAPFVSLCGEYTRRFNRPCKLLFGYMAKAIAAARAPYTATVFVDTDTFVCDVAPLLVLREQLLSRYDVLVHMPRTTQGWINSGVLGVRREAAYGWATRWQHEFTSLDDFGDQLHLLKVLPEMSGGATFRRGAISASGETPRAGAGAGPRGGAGGGRGARGGAGTSGGRGGARGAGRGKGRGGRGAAAGGGGGGGGGGVGGQGLAGRRLAFGGMSTLRVGELPAELHFRVGGVAEGAAVKLPALRGPPMLIHSKGLAALGAFTPFFAERFGSAVAMAGGQGPKRQQLLEALGGPEPEAKRKGEHALYSSRALAGFCLMLGDGWTAASAPASRGMAQQPTRRLVLNSNGSCVGCDTLPRLSGAVGVSEGRAPRSDAKPYACAQLADSCGVEPAAWPAGTERGLPEWFRNG